MSHTPEDFRIVECYNCDAPVTLVSTTKIEVNGYTVNICADCKREYDRILEESVTDDEV